MASNETSGRASGSAIARDSVSHNSENTIEEISNYDSDTSLDESIVQPEKNRRPPENAFTQQRLKAYNPIFTAKTVIPLLLIIAVVFAPLGAGMWYASHEVQDFLIDYSFCENLASLSYWSEVPLEYLDFNFKVKAKNVQRPQWKLATDDSQPFEDERRVCQIQFAVPNDLKSPIYLFYRLQNFYQNHRRYAKSLSEDQIKGKRASVLSIKDTIGQNCEPLSINHEGKIIYPCGLIANSLFNDTYSATLKAVNGTDDDYEMTEKGITWSTDKNRYQKTQYNYSEIVPPPNWYKRFPEGYNATNVPDISKWAQLQIWMRTSALPTFNKLALRNDKDTLKKGIYEISIGLHFPVLPYDGRKYIYISQRSVIGGKNDFLGISWMVAGGVCFILALVLLLINIFHPRRTGDVNLLSWNREKFEKDEQETHTVTLED